jgi:hypothetical protein
LDLKLLHINVSDHAFFQLDRLGIVLEVWQCVPAAQSLLVALLGNAKHVYLGDAEGQ